MCAGARARPVVLAVDDEPCMHDAFRLILADRYDVVSALDAHAALEILDARHVDVVLLDILMPTTSGLTVLERVNLLATRPEVIVVTALNDARLREYVRKSGAFACVTKPFADEDLQAVVALAAAPHDVAPARPPRSHRVLLIGDEVVGRASLAVLLGRWTGVTVRSVGPTTLGGLSADPPDLVVLDVSAADHGSATRLERVRSIYDEKAVVYRQPIDFGAVIREIVVALSLRGAVLRAPRITPPVADALRHVIDHLRDVKAGILADAVGVSPHHLAAQFRAELGCGVKEYLTAVRLQAAVYLRVERGETLKCIAEYVGFHDAAHLDRVSKQHLGHSMGRLGTERFAAGISNARRKSPRWNLQEKLPGVH